MANATIDLSLNASPFERGLNQAEGKARSFSSRLSGLFARTQGGTRRTEVAFGDFASNLATGNVANAISSIGTRLSGLGLAAGVGVVATIALFRKLNSDIDATAKAAGALNKELSKPLALESALSPEGISTRIESVTKGLETLVEKRKSLGSRIREAAFAGQPDVETFPGSGVLEKVDRRSPEAQSQIAGEKHLKELQSARADSLLKIAQIQDKAVHGSELEAALEKIKLDASQKRAAFLLTRPGPAQLSTFKEFAAGQLEERAATATLLHKSGLKKLELDYENRIALLKGRNIEKDEEGLLILKERAGLLSREIEQAKTAEERAELQTKLRQAQADYSQSVFQKSVSDTGRPIETEKSIRETAQVSLHDLAQYQRRTIGGSHAAQDAEDELRLARRSSIQGNLADAEMHVRRADRLKAMEPTLSDADKPLLPEEVEQLRRNASDRAKKDIPAGGASGNAAITASQMESIMAKYWGPN